MLSGVLPRNPEFFWICFRAAVGWSRQDLILLLFLGESFGDLERPAADDPTPAPKVAPARPRKPTANAPDASELQSRNPSEPTQPGRTLASRETLVPQRLRASACVHAPGFHWRRESDEGERAPGAKARN